MPIYEYACGTCRHRFETIQRASEAPLKDCPTCGESALKKLLSAPVFRLKGSGWYETDFKTGSKRNVADSGDGARDNGGDGKAKDSAGDDAKAKTAPDKTTEGKAGNAASKASNNGKTATAVAT